MGHWVLEEVPQSLIYYTCVSFKSLSGPWGLLRQCTHYLQILAFLVFHRMSTRPDPTVPSGITESRVEFSPLGCSKNTWGKAPQPLGLASRTWSCWRLEVRYFPFQIRDLHSSFRETARFASLFCDCSSIRLQCHNFIMQQLSSTCWFDGTDCFLMTV